MRIVPRFSLSFIVTVIMLKILRVKVGSLLKAYQTFLYMNMVCNLE
jgi:hypothetical protein